MSEEFNIIGDKKMIILSLLVIFLLIAGVTMFHLYHRLRIGPEQPIPFSHRVHVSEKGISCFMCHDGAMVTERAVIPPVQTCMLCHEKIIIHHPEIEKVRAHFAQNEPIEWKRVQDVPDFVFFNHSLHIHRKIDCGECHGNVKEMDRIEQVNRFSMNFCIDCHRKEKASTDCFTCHR